MVYLNVIPCNKNTFAFCHKTTKPSKLLLPFKRVYCKTLHCELVMSCQDIKTTLTIVIGNE